MAKSATHTRLKLTSESNTLREAFDLLHTIDQKISEREAALQKDMRDNPQVPTPFHTGTAITPKNPTTFRGREAAINIIDQHLSHGRREPVLVWGQRRIGKSSLINMLPAKLGSATKVLALNLQGLSGNAQHLAHPGSWIAETIQATLKLDHGPKAPQWGAVMDWLVDVDQQLRQQDQYVLFCIDEAERLQEAIANGETDSGTLDLIRQSADRLHHLRFLLSTALPLDILGDVWVDRLINGRNVEIGLWDTATTVDFIRHPIADFPDIYPTDGVDFIAQQTAGHPYRTQLFLDHLAAHLNSQKRLKATMDHLEQTYDQTVNDTWYVKDMLRQMVNAEQMPVLLAAVKDGQVAESRQANELTRLQFLERTATGYAMRVPIIRDYIAAYRL